MQKKTTLKNEAQERKEAEMKGTKWKKEKEQSERSKKYYQAQNEHDEMKLMYTNESESDGVREKKKKLYRNVG